MPSKRVNGVSSIDDFKCFVIDNNFFNIEKSIVGIKKLLYYTLINDNYIRHKTRAKKNVFISIFLSNVETDRDILGYESPYNRLIDVLHEEHNIVTGFNQSLSNSVVSNKQAALSLIQKVYDRFERYKVLYKKDTFIEENEILLALQSNLANIANNYSKNPNQTMQKEIYVILKNHNAFENISEEDLEKCISEFKEVLDLFSKDASTNEGSGGLKIKFNFLVCDEENNLDGFFESKLKWFCTQIDDISSHSANVETNITTLKKLLNFFEFEDFSDVDPRVVFQGDLILNCQFLNTYDENYRNNSIPILGYPAIKKISPKSKNIMQVLENENTSREPTFHKLKYETYKQYKTNNEISKKDADVLNSLFTKSDIKLIANDTTFGISEGGKALNLPKERIAKAFKIGDSYQVLTGEQEDNLIKLQIPFEHQLLDDHFNSEGTDGVDLHYSNALYKKSIVPLYSMPSCDVPIDYLVGESQMIVCDLYSSKTIVTKADYLSFIALIDVLTEKDLVIIGRYLKNDSNYELSLCCLAPFVGFDGTSEYKALIVTKLNYGKENKNITFGLKESAVAEKVDDSNDAKHSKKLSSEEVAQTALLSNFLDANTLSLGLYTDNINDFFTKHKGSLEKLKGNDNQTFPCTNIANNLMEEKLNMLTINSLHGSNAGVFEREYEIQLDALNSKIVGTLENKNDSLKTLKNKFYLKKIYNTQTLRKGTNMESKSYKSNKLLKGMLADIRESFDIKLKKGENDL